MPFSRALKEVTHTMQATVEKRINRKQKVILVIEDDRDMNDLVCDALDSAGYQTLSAFDGVEGLRLGEQAHPDVILLDIILPDADGVDLCRDLRRNETTRLIPIIMLTGRQDLSTKLSSYIAGAKRYITKPFQIDQLIEEVDKTLIQKQIAAD
jgi:DNA-binding response OmpR family regulator